MRVTHTIAVLNCPSIHTSVEQISHSDRYASINCDWVLEGQDMRSKHLTWLCIKKESKLGRKQIPLFSLNDTQWMGDCGFNLALSITGCYSPGRWVIILRASWRTAFLAFHPQQGADSNVTCLLNTFQGEGGFSLAEHYCTAHICISCCHTEDSIVDCWVIIKGTALVSALWNTKCLYLQHTIHPGVFFFPHFPWLLFGNLSSRSWCILWECPANVLATASHGAVDPLRNVLCIKTIRTADLNANQHAEFSFFLFCPPRPHKKPLHGRAKMEVHFVASLLCLSFKSR